MQKREYRWCSGAEHSRPVCRRFDFRLGQEFRSQQDIVIRAYSLNTNHLKLKGNDLKFQLAHTWAHQCRSSFRVATFKEATYAMCTTISQKILVDVQGKQGGCGTFTNARLRSVVDSFCVYSSQAFILSETVKWRNWELKACLGSKKQCLDCDAWPPQVVLQPGLKSSVTIWNLNWAKIINLNFLFVWRFLLNSLVYRILRKS